MADAHRGSGGSVGGGGEKDDVLAAPVEAAAPASLATGTATTSASAIATPPSESEWKQALDSVVPCVVVLKYVMVA